MEILGIVAVAKNGVIGRSDGVPVWHLPADLQFFKEMTIGQVVIMGRKTYDSIGHPLEGRVNIVITRHPKSSVMYIQAMSINEALVAARATGLKTFIIGGAEIFRQTHSMFDQIYISEVSARPKGDIFFKCNLDGWHEDMHTIQPADSNNEYDVVRRLLKRK